MLDRKQILAIFLFKFKMDHKAVETACNVSYALAQKLLTNMQCTGGLRNLKRRWEPWRWGVQWPAIESWQQPIKSHHWSTYSYTRSCPRTVSTILWSFGIWSKLERWESLRSGCLIISLKKKKIVILKYCLLILGNNNEHFFIRLWYVTKKWIFCNQWQAAQWLDEEAQKHFPKPNLHPKRVMVNVWWPAATLIHYRFLNPRETIISKKYAQQVDEMHWRLQCL